MSHHTTHEECTTINHEESTSVVSHRDNGCSRCDETVSRLLVVMNENTRLRLRYDRLLAWVDAKLEVERTNYNSLYIANVNLEKEIAQLNTLQKTLFRQLRTTEASLREAESKCDAYEVLTEDDEL